MILAEIRGQRAAIEKLGNAIRTDRLSHALIFSGPEGVGKRTTALALAKALLCPEAPGRGCGVCPECALTAAENHPDLFIEDLAKARQERATTNRLSIEQMRRVRSQVAMRPARAARKVGIIEPAEQMTADAQNALLKTLEEPPGAATLILVTSNPRALVTTILSRCQRVPFAPLDSTDVAAILIAEGVEADVADTVAPLSRGSLTIARELADAGGAASQRDLYDRLDNLVGMPIPEILDFATELSGGRGERARAEQALRAASVVEWAREKLLEAARAASETEDGEARENALADARRSATRLRSIYATARDIERSANVHLSWDRLLLDLRKR